MIIHTADSRGKANHGWLVSAHTFSFADYYDPKRIQFGALRVINDDYIAPGSGFGTHPHKDMEIITIPLEGRLAHKDSLGHAETITHGEVQVMSAGVGISHSEYNASNDEAVKLLQIWVLPSIAKVTPRYEQKFFNRSERNNKFSLIVSPDGREGSCWINQDAFFSMIDLDHEKSAEYKIHKDKNGLYVFVISGEIQLLGKKFGSRDGVGLENPDKSVNITALKKSEILFMEVPV